MLNRRTCFTCDDLVASNFEKLEFILENMEDKNPILIEQLHHYYIKETSED